MDLLKTGKEAKEAILKGIERVSIPVMETAGAEGKLAIIEDPMGVVYPRPTKDGVTVLNNVFGADRFEELGAQLIKQAADKTSYETGDGTTTTTILAHALTTRVLRLDNVNTAEVKIGLQKGLEDTLKYLDKIKKDVTRETMTQIATVSLNGDKNLGKVISEMYDTVGVHATIEVERVFSDTSSYEITPGIRLKRGFSVPHYITNNDKSICSFDKANVLIYKGTISVVDDIADYIIETKSTSTPLLIICDDIEGTVQAALIRQKMMGSLQVCVSIAPEGGQDRENALKDLSESLGCIPHDEKNKVKGTFGVAEKVIATKHDTNILPFNKELSEKRANHLEELLSEAKDKTEMELLKGRISNLKSDMVKFYVGAITEVELNEKVDRVEDAIPALRSAMKEGYVPGGGTALNYISTKLKPKGLKRDEIVGYNILVESLKEHMRVILRNAYLEVPEKNLSLGRGYNVKTRKIVNLFNEGIIDPVLITKTAITNAVSVTNIALNTNILILTDGVNK